MTAVPEPAGDPACSSHELDRRAGKINPNQTKTDGNLSGDWDAADELGNLFGNLDLRARLSRYQRIVKQGSKGMRGRMGGAVCEGEMSNVET
jgi:hypothetical protein